MDPSSYYRDNATYIEHDDARLDKMVEVVSVLRPKSLLDLGCGTGWLTHRLSLGEQINVTGVDIVPGVHADGWRYTIADLTHDLPFRAGAFECVVAGELLEHVADPDQLLREIHRVLAPNGSLVLSTPNIVSWANRVLVPLGIQPLATETSSSVSLGRRWRMLGQGSQVQGHLKVFSHRALAEILDRYGFDVTAKFGLPAEFPFPASMIDHFFTRFVPLASDLLYVARRRSGPVVVEPPARYDPRRPRRAPRPRARS